MIQNKSYENTNIVSFFSALESSYKIQFQSIQYLTRLLVVMVTPWALSHKDP
jgi:hypothetical protein